MKTIKLLLIISCAFLTISSFAENPAGCSLVGTWYGGSEYKYKITMTPITGDRLAVVGQADFDWASGFGFKVATAFTGEFLKLQEGRYVGQIVQLYTTSDQVPPPEDSVGQNAARGWTEFTDCDNLIFTIDFFVAYFHLSSVPFVDKPDFSYLPPGGKIIETYHRMPTKCPVCDPPTP